MPASNDSNISNWKTGP